MDDLTKEQRHINMSHIRSKGTKPEEMVCKYLFSKGFRYRKNVRDLPGCPDIVLKKYKAVVFVNGCFWHGHNCPKFILPKSNIEYWSEKITRNISRDIVNYELLKEAGWTVVIVWECELKKAIIDNTMSRVINEITYSDKD